MSGSEVRVPPLCFWLIRAASWIVPHSGRGAWRKDREREIWHWWAFLCEHGAATRDARIGLVRHCWRFFGEAFWRRFDREQFFPGLRSAAGTPRFLLCFLALAIAAATGISGGFSGARSIFAPLPYRDPDRLVVFLQDMRTMGPRMGVPYLTAEVWKMKSRSVAAFGTWSAQRIQSGSDPQYYRGMAVTQGFFALLGCAPALGREFEPREYDAAILGDSYWRLHFGGDPHVVGRTISINNRTARVIGVLPRRFRFFYEEPDVWTLLDPRHPHHSYYAVMGRLRDGVSREQARSELQAIAIRIRDPWAGRQIGVASLAEVVAQACPVSAKVPVVAGFVVLAAIALQCWIFGRSGKRQWKLAAFFLAKSAGLAGALSCFWIEAAAHVRDGMLAAILAWVYLTVLLGLMWFSIRDQKRRCPECLCRLTMPVTIGSWSSPLLEPVSTELVCRQGHGTLNFPETASSASEPRRWTALDTSWRDLFNSTK